MSLFQSWSIRKLFKLFLAITWIEQLTFTLITHVATLCCSNAVCSWVTSFFMPCDSTWCIRSPQLTNSSSATGRPRARYRVFQGFSFLYQDHPNLRYSQTKVETILLYWREIEIIKMLNSWASMRKTFRVLRICRVGTRPLSGVTLDTYKPCFTAGWGASLTSAAW